MADITVTAANVVPGTGATLKTATAGEAIAAGKSVVINPDTKKLMLADNDSATAYVRGAGGVSVNGAALNQPCTFITDGPFNPGATVVKGTTYCVSSTAGGICPQADLASGDEVVIIGVASDTDEIVVGLRDTGVVL